MYRHTHCRGVTWTDLGPVIETPAASVSCGTNNQFFVGGVGDFSVVLDADRHFAYFYYTQFAEAADAVGVSVARLAWADRDQPSGRVDIWSDGVWLPPTSTASRPGSAADDETPVVADPDWTFPLATPFLRAANRWDDVRGGVDVFWGPSIHWNTALQVYVMLLNKATSNDWEQGGVYVSFNPRLDDPWGGRRPRSWPAAVAGIHR